MSAPADVHKEYAKEVAVAKSEPEHSEAQHSATVPAHWGMTHKQPVSQYGQGVLEVERVTHDLAHVGSKL